MSTPASSPIQQISQVSNSSLSPQNGSNGHSTGATEESSESSEINGSKKKPHIAIIGAGMAGLRAAQVLLEESDDRYEVTILEARDRIGGRIYTSTEFGKPLDLGPNWVHGTDDNPIVPLAESVRANFHDFYANAIVYDVDGRLLDNQVSEEIWNELWSVIERAIKYSKRYKDVIDDRWSLWDYCATIADFRCNASKVSKDGDEVWEAEKRRILDEEIVFDFEDAIERANGNAMRGTVYGGEGVKERRNGHVKEGECKPGLSNGIIARIEADQIPALELIHGHCVSNRIHTLKNKELFMRLVEMWGRLIGDGVKKQSLRCFFLEEPMEGDNVFVGSTYGPLVNKLAEPVISSKSILFNSPVTEITSLAPDASSPATRVNVTISGGKMLDFDAVICTIPLGCLKQNAIQFHPPLPNRISEGIASLGYGNLEKVYIEFPSPAFWMLENGLDAPPDQITFLHPPQPIEPEITSHEKQWHLSAFSLAHLEEPYSQPVLLFYTYGAVSKYLTSSVLPADENKRKQAIIEIFEPYYSRLRNYDASDPHCRPKNIIQTNWSNDQYSGYGSYTNFKVGLRYGDADVLALRGELEGDNCGEVMEGRRVWISGEHTAPVVALGTVAGAYWSGEQAVHRMRKVLERV